MLDRTRRPRLSGANTRRFVSSGRAAGFGLECLESRTLFAGDGLRGAYFNGANFNTAATSRVDPTVNFDWGYGSPATGVNTDNFSVRWTGQVQAQTSGTTTFYTNSNDGVRLWVNNQLVIDQWYNHTALEFSGSIALVAGQKYDMKLEYYEATNTASAQLSWSGPSLAKQIIPQANLYSSAATQQSSGDTQAPSTPAAPTLGSRTNNSATVNWTPASDNVGVNKYAIYRGSTNVGTVWGGTFTYTDTGLAAGTNYAYSLIAIDTAGNQSARGAALNVTTLGSSSTPSGDTQAPSTPAAPTLGTRTSNSATINWTPASDNVGVNQYAIYRGSTNVGTVWGGTFSYTDTGLAANTNYSYSLVAIDTAGNQSTRGAALNVTTLASGGTTPPPTNPPASGPPIAGNWNLKFNDDFNSIDTSRWVSRYWWDKNNGSQANFDPSKTTVNNGVLSITATKQSNVGLDGVTRPYLSGLLTTGGIKGKQAPGFTFQYGYVEARSKAAPGNSMWSAIWMLPADYSDTHELDLHENIGRTPNNFNGFLHWGSGSQFKGFNTNVGTDVTAGFHVYGVDWQPDHISWYMDGKLIYTYATPANIPNKPLYLIMNLDVGASWAGPVDATTPASSTWQVDYLRVWQK